RTPMTSIKGFVETIQQHAQNDPEELDRFLKIIGKQADRLAAILEDLLALSRMEQEGGRMELVLESVALKTCLQSAVQICSHKAVEKGVSVVVQCEDGLTARVNGPLFEQALANLLDNAVKYSESGKTVFIAAERTNGDLTVSVRDEGCGIAPEHLPRLFERFYRVDKARSRAMGGTGLGLAIVKHIVHVHRGRVEVESAPGKGSTFRIVLPAR
ncbi:MAG TPA: ATP-binding protein, partial [Candidatus Hydrogenedentes bacterium]|nr:ATP-binding protein [Candidatus Hydrogenedentota bacterium]